MLQFGDAVNEVIVWNKRLGANEKLTKPIVRRLMNEALKSIYVQAIMSDPGFYATRLQFTTTTLLAYPDHYRATLLLECTSVGCTAGFAIPTKRRDVTFILTNDSNPPTAADPIFYQTGQGIAIAPAQQGYHYYLKTIGDVTDDSTDLETIIPWLWIEPLILKTTELARMHTSAQGMQTTTLERGLQLVDIAHKSIKEGFKSRNLFDHSVPTPSFISAGM